MKISSEKTAFLDSSVLFTAVNSPIGGSSKLFILQIKLITSKVVLTEVERNVRNKLDSYHLDRFFMLVNQLTILNQIPDEKIISEAKKLIAEKDAVILAEAKQAKSDFLVTLDQKHFFTKEAEKFLQPKRIVTPKMLIELLET